MKVIGSAKNLELKKMLLLYKKSRERKKQGLFVIEGEREIINAIKSNYILERIFLEEGIGFNNANIKSVINNTPTSVIEKKTFKKISIRSGGEKIIAIARSKLHVLKTLKLTRKSLIVVLEEPEKPGNIGALIRTAAAAGIDALIIANPKTDLYHPQIIRNSLGGLFSIPIAMDSSDKVISFLKKNCFNIIVTALISKAKHYKRIKYEKPFALIFGSEDKGINDFWIKKANEIVQIPVKFPIDSLNLSVSAGVLIYHCLD